MTLIDMSSFEKAADAPEDPFVFFKQWLKEAESSEPDDANAACLATADEYGRPGARIILLKSYDERGFTFFTNRESRKARALAVNPNAAMAFYWKSLDRQVHIEGSVSMTSDRESDDYFASRPRGSRIGAWASSQSRKLEERKMLLNRVKEYEMKYEGQESVPRPPYWGGYTLTPARIEFWQEGKFRLHHRVLYTRLQNGWEKQLLYP